MRRVVLDDVPCLQGPRGVVGVLRLGGVDLRLRCDVRQRQAGARDHAAAPDRGDDDVERARVLHELQRARRLPGDHPRIVVGVNEVRARPVDEFLQGRLARGGARLAFDHRPAIPAHGRLLGLRRRPRHDDRGADSPPPRGVAEGQGMIARGVGRDAPLRLLVGQPENRVAGAPNLEGACLLEVLTLEEQVRPGQPIQVRARQHRCAMDVGTNPLARGLHIFKGGDVHGAVFRLAVG